MDLDREYRVRIFYIQKRLSKNMLVITLLKKI